MITSAQYEYGQARLAWWLAREDEDPDRWLAERCDVIGASEVWTLINRERGVADYRALVAAKRGQPGRFPGNYATRRGHHMEPFLRAEFERETGKAVEVVPYPLEHATEPRLRVNLDSYLRAENAPAELKCAFSARKAHVLAMLDGVGPGGALTPEPGTGKKRRLVTPWRGYYWQLQAQMCVLGSTHGYWIVDTGSNRLWVIRVEADPTVWPQILDAVRDFFATLYDDLPPEAPIDLNTIAEGIAADAA